MHKPDPIETILARLMPPAMSQSGQHGIAAMLDELAASANPAAVVRPAAAVWTRRLLAGGIAAAGVAAALIFSSASSPSSATWANPSTPAMVRPTGLVLVGESDRVEAMTDEGWQEDSDGSPMQATRLSVVEENSLLDVQTGIVMQVSQPREETFLMPVSSF